MKFAMMGSGGVGGVFGAHLADAGYDVAFIARGAHLKGMKTRGLKVRGATPNDLHINPVKATSDPAEIGPVDYVFINVKLWDTEDAARAILPLIGAETAVISFQNGINKDDILRVHVGQQHIVGGASYVAATIAEPGVIQQKGTAQKLVFGEYNRTRSERLEKLSEACSKAHIKAVLADDIEAYLWEKFVVLIAMSAVTSSCRLPIGKVRSEQATRELLLDAMREAAAIGKAKGVRIPDDIVEKQMGYLDNLAPDVSSSMHYDIEHGNRLELPWLSGTVVQLGKQLNIPTPVNRALVGVLSPHVMGRSRVPA